MVKKNQDFKYSTHKKNRDGNECVRNCNSEGKIYFIYILLLASKTCAVCLAVAFSPLYEAGHQFCQKFRKIKIPKQKRVLCIFQRNVYINSILVENDTLLEIINYMLHGQMTRECAV